MRLEDYLKQRGPTPAWAQLPPGVKGESSQCHIQMGNVLMGNVVIVKDVLVQDEPQTIIFWGNKISLISDIIMKIDDVIVEYTPAPTQAKESFKQEQTTRLSDMPQTLMASFRSSEKNSVSADARKKDEVRTPAMATQGRRKDISSGIPIELINSLPRGATLSGASVSNILTSSGIVPQVNYGFIRFEDGRRIDAETWIHMSATERETYQSSSHISSPNPKF